MSRERSCARGDLAADAAAARGIGHQHGIAAGQRQVGRQRGALVAALFLDHLHQHHLTALDDFLDLVLAARTEGAFRHLFHDVVAADGFDHFFLGLVAIVFVFVMLLVAMRRGGRFGVIRSGGLAIGAFGVPRIVGMGSVFERVLGVTMLVVPVFVVPVFVVTVLGVFFMAFGAGRRIRRGIGRPDGCGVRQVGPEFGGSLAGMNMAVIIIMGRVVVMLVRRLVTLMVVIAGMAVVAEAVAIFAMVVRGVITVMVMRLLGLGEIRRAALDHAALHAFAIAAAARVAVARAAAVGAVLGFLLGLAMGAFVGLDQRLAVGDRDLVIIRDGFR